MAQHEKFLLVYSPHLHSVSIDLLNLYPSSPLWMGSYRTQSIFFIHFKIKILWSREHLLGGSALVLPTRSWHHIFHLGIVAILYDSSYLHSKFWELCGLGHAHLHSDSSLKQRKCQICSTLFIYYDPTSVYRRIVPTKPSPKV